MVTLIIPPDPPLEKGGEESPPTPFKKGGVPAPLGKGRRITYTPKVADGRYPNIQSGVVVIPPLYTGGQIW